MRFSLTTSALLALCIKAATASTVPVIVYQPNGIIGACNEPIQNNFLEVALNDPQFANGKNCDRRVKVSHGGKSLIVTVSDKCPTCGSGIALTPSAFEHFAPESAGWFQATWEFERE